MTKLGKDIVSGDVLTLVDGDSVTIKRAVRRSKFHHKAMIYETTNRRAIAIRDDEEVTTVNL